MAVAAHVDKEVKMSSLSMASMMCRHGCTVLVLIIHVAVCSVFPRLSLGRALVVGLLPARLICPPLRI
jgi:hypothetical protein